MPNERLDPIDWFHLNHLMYGVNFYVNYSSFFVPSPKSVMGIDYGMYSITQTEEYPELKTMAAIYTRLTSLFNICPLNRKTLKVYQILHQPPLPLDLIQ